MARNKKTAPKESETAVNSQSPGLVLEPENKSKSVTTQNENKTEILDSKSNDTKQKLENAEENISSPEENQTATIDEIQLEQEFANDEYAPKPIDSIADAELEAVTPKDSAEPKANIKKESKVIAEPQKTSRFAKFRLTKRRKYFIAGFASILLFSIIGLVAVNDYYSNHALPKTRIAGSDVGNKSFSEIDKIIDDKSAGYYVQIEGAATRPTLDELGVKLNAQSTKDAYRQKQNSFAKKLAVSGQNNTNFVIEVDQSQLDKYLMKFKQSSDQLALNAQLIIKDGNVSIEPEVNSKVTEIRDAVSKIKNSESNMEPLVLKQEVYEEAPKITKADLQKNMQQVQSMLSTPVNLKIKSDTITASKAQIGSWVTLDQDSVTLDKARIGAFVDSSVKPYINVPKATIVTKDPSGAQRVLSNGVDGSAVKDKTVVIDSIYQGVNSSLPVNVEATFEYAKSPVIEAGDYPKWIEVDLTNKRMYAYEKDQVVRSFLVSAGAKATPTVVGTYKIQFKVRKQNMRGYNADGSQYEQPNVEWINYFFEDYAIHGNYWRPTSVFGNVNTSHGCVGVLNYDAEWVYNWAPVGTTVITHY